MESMNDIIAEMRSVAFSMKVHDAMMSEVYDILCGVAFRLEAAWKREKPVGNARALREALEGMCKASQDVFRSFARETFAGERRLDSLGRAFDKAQAALSAPARNCDRFADEDDAFATWHDSLNDGDVVSVRNAFRWLFAPAAERKGEGDE